MKKSTQFFNDLGEGVMIPDDMLPVQKVSLLWPKWIGELKEMIFKKRNVQGAIDQIKASNLKAKEKGAVLFVASAFRLTRKF